MTVQHRFSAILLALLALSVCVQPAWAYSDDRRTHIARATTAYQAMDGKFYDRHLYVEYDTSLGTDDYAVLWSYSRAMSATLDAYELGIIGLDELRERISVIHAYQRHDRPIYQALVMPPFGRMDDVYYDDNAWIGLNLVRYYQLTGDAWALSSAIQIFNTDILERGDEYGCSTGGLYWKEQKDGETNHDRATITTATISLLGVRLYKITGDPHFWEWSKGARTWLELYMADPDTQLYHDKISHACEIDATIYSYSQGIMIGTYATLFEITEDRGFLAVAELLAERMLSEGRHRDQSIEGNAIYFKNLLVLSSVTSDARLKRKIRGTIARYANALWENERRHRVPGLFYVDEESEWSMLLQQASVVEILALLGLDEARYRHL